MSNDTKPQTEKEPRGARRKRATRQKLINAGLTLMSERGKDGVSINEITEVADVGFGSFYNHFESKDAIYDALVEEILNSIGKAIEVATETIDDPAAILATAIRNVMAHAEQNPVWGRFLLRTAFSSEALSGGMGQFMLKDLQRGIDSERFLVDDPIMSFLNIGGTVLGALSLQLELKYREENVIMLAQAGGYNLENIPERTASTVLQALGLNKEEADQIAKQEPLPISTEENS